jgi:hypothetical protein
VSGVRAAKPARQNVSGRECEAFDEVVMHHFFMDGLSHVEQTFSFLLLCVCLGVCFIVAFWEIEQARIRWRTRKAERATSVRLAAFRETGDRRM